MIVGIMTIELFIPVSDSLKSKRFAIKSIKERLKNRFNVSISEVDNNDKWQRATLGVAMVSNETKYIESNLSKILNYILCDHRVEVLDSKITYI